MAVRHGVRCAREPKRRGAGEPWVQLTPEEGTKRYFERFSKIEIAVSFVVESAIKL